MMARDVYPLRIWFAAALIVPTALGVLGVVVASSVDPAALAFDSAHLWWLGGIVPASGLVALYGAARRRRALRRFASGELGPWLCPRVSSTRQAIRAMLFVTSVLLVIAAIVGPRWGAYLEKQKVRGVDIVVALDVSRSMLARDVEPSRLERARRELRQQLTERGVFHGANRLALVAFAGAASMRMPLAADHAAFRTKLEQLRVGLVSRGGTNVAKAIDAATDLFAASPPDATRMILVVTDGESHEGDAVESARKAYKEKGIRVYGVGVGDPASTVGAQVPFSDAPGSQPLLHDGQIVFSKPDVQGLRAMSEAGGGEYVPIESLNRLVDRIANMRSSELTTEERMRRRPQYQWFLAVAAALLMIEATMREVRSSAGDEPLRVWQQEAASA